MAVAITTLPRTIHLVAKSTIDRKYLQTIFFVGLINSFLSWKAFIPLSRLTYGTYLIHWYVMQFYFQSLQVPYHATEVTVVSNFIVNLLADEITCSHNQTYTENTSHVRIIFIRRHDIHVNQVGRKYGIAFIAFL